MVEKVVIEVTGTDNLQPTINDLEKLGKVDAANAAQFKKTNAEFRKGAAETVTSVKGITDSLKTLVPAISAAFAVQAVVAFGKASLDAFIQAERGEKLLFNALEKNTAAFERLKKSAENYQKTTIFDDDTIIAAQTFLATQGRTEAQINKVIAAATNLSAVTGDSLQSSVEKLDATYEGNIGRLGKLDSRFKDLTKTELENGAAIDLIAQKYKGFAEAELDTTAGKLQRLANAWDNVKEKVGEAIVDMGDRIADNTITGGLIAKLLFGKEPQAAQTELEKTIQGYQEVIASFNQTTKKYQDQLRAANPTVGDLLDQIKKLQEGLKDADSAEKYNAKMSEIKVVQEQLEKIIGKTTDKIKEQKKELDKPVQLADALGGTLDVTDYEAKQKEINDLQQAGADEATRIKAEEVAERLRLDDILAENEKKNQDEVTANLEEEARRRTEIEQIYVQGIEQLAGSMLGIIQNLQQQETQSFIQNLDYQLQQGKISDEQYTQQRKAFLTKQAEDERELAIFQATVKAALAVINAITTGDPYTAAARAAVAAAIGLAEVIAITAAPLPQFEKGGKVKGKSHREGGVHAELEGDEFVISKKAARRIGFDNLELLNKGIVPIKMLRQSLADQKAKGLETSMMKIFGSTDFDTYPIEKLLKKSMQNDRQIGQQLVRELRGSTRKRGGLK